MESFDKNKEVKQADKYVCFWSDLTDIFLLSAITTAILCAGTGTIKAIGLGGKNTPQLNSLILTSFIASASMFFWTAMGNKMKKEAVEDRKRLLEKSEDKNVKIAHQQRQTITDKEHTL